MEYAVKLEVPKDLPSDPRLWCDARWGEALPSGPLTAIYFGSDFCEDRIPGAAEAADLCKFAASAGLQAVLLTPLVRPRGLDRVGRLLSQLTSAGWAPSVVFNDWGVMDLLRRRHPRLPRRGGRLLNRALRDPRLAGKSETVRRESDSPEGRGAYVRALLQGLGATAVETDADLEGGFLGWEGAALQRTLHLPYVAATSGRNCVVRASTSQEHAFGRGLDEGCRAPCRRRWLDEVRKDTQISLYRDGNALLYEAPEKLALAHTGSADRIVLHRRPTP